MALTKKNPMRYAHCSGHIDVCYSSNGKYLVTCGTDGDMRVWLGIEDEDPTSKVVANEKALTVACYGNQAYVGSDNNCVNVYKLPECGREGIVTRFTAPVTHLSLSADGVFLASGSCDMEVHVTNTSSHEGVVLAGHKGAILSVAMDPKGTFVASSSCDGSVIVWNRESQKMVKTWPNVYPSSNDFWASGSLVRISWLTKTGRLLAIPMKREVLLVHRDTWAQQTILSDLSVENYYITSSFSPCGRLLAATSMDGCLSVWDLNIGDTVLSESYEPKLPLCGNAWNPIVKPDTGEREIALCDNQGHLGTIVFTISPENNIRSHTEDATSVTENDDASITSDIHMSPLKDADDDIDSRPGSRASSASPMPESNDFIAAKKLAVEQQPPFQPTSTPLHFKRRFMVWNDVGIVKAYDVEGDLSIDVEFHDSATHHPLTLNNHFHYDKAALTKNVLVLSGEKQSDSRGSKVLCILLQSWDGTKQWDTELPTAEETLALAAGDGFIAIATDKRNLRIFSLTGNQREILSIPGTIVCLAAHHKQLMLVYHAATGNNGDQAMTMMLLEVGTYSVRRLESPQAVPLSPGVLLLWAGFTDEGNPCTYDHEGSLRVLAPSGLWHTLCDTNSALSKSVLDGIFMIGVSQSEQKMRGLLCKGAKYPHTQPRPNLSEFPINMPVCEPETDKSRYEDVYMRMKLSVAALTKLRHVNCSDPDTEHKVDTSKHQFQECLLKLFAIAARQDLCMRACELYTCMPAQNLRELARKYANNINKPSLLERLEQLDLDHESDAEPEEAPQSPEYPVPSRLSRPSIDSVDNDSYHDTYTFINSIESALQAAKRARLEASVSNTSLPSTPSQVNPFRKTSDKKTYTLAPLPVQRPLSSFKKNISAVRSPIPLVVDKPAKVSLQTKLNVFSKAVAKRETNVTSTSKSDEVCTDEEDIIEDSQVPPKEASITSKTSLQKFSDEDSENTASKRHSQETPCQDSETKRLKTTSKLLSFAFKKK